MTKATASQITLLRLLSQQIVTSTAKTPADVVRNLLALQAQDFPASQWAIGVRLPTSNASDVLEAFNKGEIVRSWPMRGTLHTVAAEDLSWMLSVTSERTLRSAATRKDRLHIQDPMIDLAAKTSIQLLRGGKSATRAEFLTALTECGFDIRDQRGYHVIWFLAHMGILCWGPMRGTAQALVLSDEWLPKTTPSTYLDALGQFLFRYLRGHGPATVKDFVWWNKVTVADAKLALEAVRDQLTELIHDGCSYWISTATYERVSPNIGKAKPSVVALGAFDEHLLGYQDRSLELQKEFAPRVCPGANGIFRSTIVVGGKVAGTWRREVAKSTVVVTTEPFTPMSTTTKTAFAKAIDTYGAFLGKRVTVR